MSALVPFAYGDSLVRVVELAGEPWWVAGDVAKVLGYTRHRDMARMLDDDERGAHIVRTLGGDQEVAIISESGLYHAILKSRRPDAKQFRKWVTSEVIPSIRKTGAYQLPRAASLPDPRADEIEDNRLRPVNARQIDRRELKQAALTFVEEAMRLGATRTAGIEEAATLFGLSRATIWNDFGRVRMVPEADRLTALTPLHGAGGRQAEIHPEAWLDLTSRLARPGTTIGRAIAQTRNRAVRNGWTPIPCDRTLRRRIDALKSLPDLTASAAA